MVDKVYLLHRIKSCLQDLVGYIQDLEDLHSQERERESEKYIS